MTTERPVPVVNADSKPYWDAARAGRLVLQRCVDCRALRFYPRHVCPRCWSADVEWVEVSGRGRVHSFTVIHRPPSPAFAAHVPYVVALVDLEEGPRMMANIVGDDAFDVRIDDAVTVVFEDRGDAKLPQFRRSAR